MKVTLFAPPAEVWSSMVGCGVSVSGCHGRGGFLERQGGRVKLWPARMGREEASVKSALIRGTALFASRKTSGPAYAGPLAERRNNQ